MPTVLRMRTDHCEVRVDLELGIDLASIRIVDVVRSDILPVLELEEVAVNRLKFASPIGRHLNTRMDLRPLD